MNIKAGDLIFAMNESLISKLVRYVETGKFGQMVPSHVAIVEYIDTDSNVIYILEAVVSGIRRVMLFPTYKGCTIWVRRMKEPRDIPKGLRWASWQRGKKYDYTALIGIYLRTFFRLLGPNIYNRVRFIRNFLDSKQRFYCAEYTAIYGGITGKKLWHHPDAQVTPYDLWRSPETYSIES